MVERPKYRNPAVDAMRGMVMVLMTVDHASYAFNAQRYVTDSKMMYASGSAIPATQFLVRWMTHICAPTFIFLAGLVLAYSIARKTSVGMADKRVDTDLILRGLFIITLDPLWMSLGFGGRSVFQVLYAIGGGFCCLVLLRRLGLHSVLGIGLALMIGGEALAGVAIWLGHGEQAGIVGVFFATGGRLGNWGFVLYPLFPWLAYMILGYGWGRLMMSGAIKRPVRWFFMGGLVLLLLFVLVRGVNGYGNMLLYREDLSLLQWLHVSKYPPSLSFGLLTLGGMGIFLALFYRIYGTGKQPVCKADPLMVFGRVPLFFYLLHVHLLSGGAILLGEWKKGGLTEVLIATVVVLAVLYPLCQWYAGFKKNHPTGVFRFL